MRFCARVRFAGYDHWVRNSARPKTEVLFSSVRISFSQPVAAVQVVSSERLALAGITRTMRERRYRTGGGGGVKQGQKIPLFEKFQLSTPVNDSRSRFETFLRSVSPSTPSTHHAVKKKKNMFYQQLTKTATMIDRHVLFKRRLLCYAQ